METSLDPFINAGREVAFKSVDEEIRKKIPFKVKVFRIGVRHFSRFNREISGAVQLLAGASINLGDKKSPGLQYLAYMVPYVMCNLLPLVGETTRIEPAEALKWDDVPHFLLPEIIEAWIDENFGSKEKWLPWVAVAEKMVNGLSDQTIGISETISKILSKQATPSETSSTAQQTSTPTPAGA